MDVWDIVKKYLDENGYDGLHNGEGCGCGDIFIFPCINYNCRDCVPAYQITCIGEKCPARKYCELDDSNSEQGIVYAPDKDFCKKMQEKYKDNKIPTLNGIMG